MTSNSKGKNPCDGIPAILQSNPPVGYIEARINVSQEVVIRDQPSGVNTAIFLPGVNAAGISYSSVQRIWQAHGLKWGDS
jgi:hypothetical protein